MACPTDRDDTIFDLHFPTPPTDSQMQADPSLKEKTWHLNWMPLVFLASFRPKRQPTRFTGEIWVNFVCRALGASIPLLRLMLLYARNVLGRILCLISMGITCSVVRSTLGPSLVMIRHECAGATGSRQRFANTCQPVVKSVYQRDNHQPQGRHSCS